MISAPELVSLVMERTGASTPTELARALRMSGYTAPRKITRWLNGDSSPDFENTLALLSAAGLLNLDAPVREATSSGKEPTLAAIEALDRRLDTEVIPKLDNIADAQRQAERSRT